MGQPQADEKQVLLVDDDPAIRMLWERFLARWGLSFDLAASGLEGIELARRTHFQVMITDLAMPGMPGVELIRRLKADQPELEIIVVTGHGTVEVAVEIMKAGAYEFITKPINFSHAELVIRKCLEQISARQENVRLRQINRDLETLNEIKEKFIAITNHELRTPVGVIGSAVEILEKELRNGALAPLVAMLSRSARHLNEIVGQMHEISRAKSERLVLEPSGFALKDLCREIEEELVLAVQKRHHRVVWDVPAQLFIRADRVKFKKVVRELMNNAVKFTADGGAISIAARVDDQARLVMSVTDTGIGIAEENLERIFQLFYEVGDATHHHTSKEDFLGGGMGVGLAIVHDIVSAHQGRIEVTSTLGAGSTFTLVIPQAGSLQAWSERERAYG